MEPLADQAPLDGEHDRGPGRYRAPVRPLTAGAREARGRCLRRSRRRWAPLSTGSPSAGGGDDRHTRYAAWARHHAERVPNGDV